MKNAELNAFWKIEPWIARLMLLPPVFIITMISRRFLLDPLSGAGGDGIALTTATATTHMRVMSVFIFMNALTLLYLLISKDRIRRGFAFVALIMLMAIIVRAYGVSVDSTPLDGELKLFVAEGVFLAISVIGFLLETIRAKKEGELV